jgi:putative addiction module component (TIGR02574 family)
LEDVWDSLEDSGQTIAVPPWHQAELDRRLDQPATEPGETWDEARARLRKSS